MAIEVQDAQAQLELVRMDLAQVRAELAAVRTELERERADRALLQNLSRQLLLELMRQWRHRYGRRSERRPGSLPPPLPESIQRLLSPEMWTLLGVVQPAALHAPAGASASTGSGGTRTAGPRSNSSTPATHRRHRPAGSGRRPLPKHLPVRTTVLWPSADELCCPGCERALRKIGEQSSDVLEWNPSSYVIVRTVRPQFACAHCKGAGVLGAEAPSPPLQGCYAGAGLLGNIIVSKFCDVLPLYRQERIARRQGVPLSRATMSRWITAVAALVRPLVERVLLPRLLAQPRVHTDATGLPVMQRGQLRRGHAFVYLAVGEVCVFRYHPQHTGDVVGEHLSGFAGTLICDAATIYDALFRRTDGPTESACWSHGRRYVFDALWTDPAAAEQGLEHIEQIFEADRVTAHLPLPERTAARAERARLALEALTGWREEQRGRAPPGSLLRRAVTYLDNQWEALTRFVQDGALPLTNNAAERELRRIALGRSNWLWVGSDLHAEDAMVLLSLIATCTGRGIEPWGYLSWLIERIGGWDHRRLEALSPWVYQQSQQQPSKSAA